MATSTRPGDLLAGRYRLVDLLSEAGGGRFWRAHDLVLERKVALHAIAESDPRAAGLLRAAADSARVLDPRILRVLDADTREGLCFVVNEWGTGTSLDILVTHAGPLGPRRSAWLAADVAGAIVTAHQAGVAHGRLTPENVLIDRFGSIRLIGLCVDAALHGIADRDTATDRADLGGLLYCALTGVWPGPSSSIVPPAPDDHGVVLAPRQVRAGVPKALDLLWRELCLNEHDRSRRSILTDPGIDTAAGIHERLLDFLGDTTGLPESLAASIPPFNDLRPLSLPSVADPTPHDADPLGPDDETLGPPPVVRPLRPRADEAEPGAVDGDPRSPGGEAGPGDSTAEREAVAVSSTADGSDRSAGTGDAVPPAVTDLPTEAGMPVFGEDDVEWLRARSTPPPPPPPFEQLPARPLFAPEPAPGEPVRRPRDDVPPPPAVPSRFATPAAAPAGFWPWDAEAVDPLTGEFTGEMETVPGRNWLRLGLAIGAALVLLVAVVVAFNLGRGRSPLGGVVEDDPTPSASETATTPPAEPVVLPASEASFFDPLGDDGDEHADEASNAIDGDPATTWRTDTYFDPLGPSGLKTGVGLYVDLGRAAEVSEVDLTLVGSPTTVQLFGYEQPPTEAPTGDPIAESTAEGEEATLTAAEPATARYLLVWFTALPTVSGGFRGELGEVVVRGIDG